MYQLLLIRDHYTNDADIMDYDGNILYNTKSLPFYSSLPASSIDRYSAQFWINGYYMFRLIDGSVAFVEQLTGDYEIIEYEEAEQFAAGLPPLPFQDDPLVDGSMISNPFSAVLRLHQGPGTRY